MIGSMESVGAAYEDGDNGKSHAETTILIDRGYFGVSNSKFGIMYRFSSIATWIVHTKPTGPKAALTNLRSIYRGLHGGGPIIAVIAHKRTWLWDQWKSTSPLIRQGDYDWYSHRIWSTQNGWFVHSTTHTNTYTYRHRSKPWVRNRIVGRNGFECFHEKPNRRNKVKKKKKSK